MRVVEGVRAVSPLWARALAAKNAARGSALRAPGRPGGARPAGGPDATLLQGAIDLVFEEEDGWVLVDYKSDTVTDRNRAALEAFYAAADRPLPALLAEAHGPADPRGIVLPPHRRAGDASDRLHAAFTGLVRS